MRSGKKLITVPVNISVPAAVEKAQFFFNVAWTCGLLNGGKIKMRALTSLYDVR